MTGGAQPPALEAVVERIDAWSGRDVSWEPVVGGITNVNWRVSVSGLAHDFFVKVPGPGTERFIDRDAAHDASLKAAACGYGPRVFHYLPDLGVQVIEFVEGFRSATNADFQRADVRVRAVQALRAFHRGEPLVLTKTIFDMIDEHLADAERLGAHAPPDLWWLREQYRRARAALQAAGLDLVPCMNDTLAANFMLAEDGRLRLIDFEYASNNDVHSELAVWFGEMFFPADVERELLEEYFGHVTAQTVARVQVHKALADLKWSTWAMIQRRISPVEFDFHKYGVWKHLRARMVLRDSRWEEWLRLV